MIAVLSIFLPLVALIVIIILFCATGNFETLYISLACEFIIIIGSYLLGKFKGWKYGLKLKLFEIFKPNLEIRLSPSYLYRIQINNKYLLVKNRNRDIFQPVGGVYKYFDSAKNFLNEIEFKVDNKINIDTTSEKDLRIRIKAKYISKFLDWFYSNKDRETDFYREFKEELLDKNILSCKFNKIKMNKLKSIKNTIEYSEFYKMYEIKPKDIIEIEYTEDQYIELKELYSKSSTDYYFADEEEILNYGITAESQEVKFGDQTKYII